LFNRKKDKTSYNRQFSKHANRASLNEFCSAEKKTTVQRFRSRLTGHSRTLKKWMSRYRTLTTRVVTRNVCLFVNRHLSFLRLCFSVKICFMLCPSVFAIC